MKIGKFGLVILCFLFIILIYHDFNMTGLATMRIGDVSEIGGQELKILTIGADFVKVQIGEEKGMIRQSDERMVSGVLIKVERVFYVEEPEGRFAELNLEVKQAVKTEEEADEQEKKNADECWQASDCDDEDEETTDLCKGTPKKCYNEIILQCKADIDCDDGKENTEDKCIKNECFNEKLAIQLAKKEMPSETESKSETEQKTAGEESWFSRLIKRIFG